MKKKPTCDYTLFHPFAFSVDSEIMIPATDIDAILWKNNLEQKNSDFTIYLIKPTYYEKFKIVEIDKVHTSFGRYFKYNDFFENYDSIVGLYKKSSK